MRASLFQSTRLPLPRAEGPTPRARAFLTSRLAALALLAIGCAASQRGAISEPALLAAIRSAEEGRDGKAPAIARGLSSDARPIKIGALRALARTQQIGTSSAAIPFLADPDPEIATWAAFAVGQIAEPAGERALIDSLSGRSIAPEEILLALGRAGTATAAHAVAAMLDDRRPLVRSRAAIALGLMAKRLAKAVPASLYLPKLAPLVRDPDREVRFGAVYALFRLAAPASAAALLPALADPDPEIRANALRGLGAAHAAAQSLDVVADDVDWRVRVERARALGAIGKDSPAEAPVCAARLSTMLAKEAPRFNAGGRIASGTATHVLLAIINAASELKTEGAPVFAELEKLLLKSGRVSSEQQPDVARLACAVAYGLDDAEKVVRRVRACGDRSILEWRREQLAARLLGRQGTEEAVRALVAMSVRREPQVRLAAVEALAEIDRASSVLALFALLDSEDPLVASGAAEALARPDRARFRPSGLIERIGRALHRALPMTDANFAIPFLDALGALGAEAAALVPDLEVLANDPRAPIRRRAAKARAAITQRAVPLGTTRVPFPYPRPAPVDAPARLTLATVRGPITIELFSDLAPTTTGTLLALARGGFYDGKTFHRIVSDFVAQGGCPRGDGSGGPGYTIEDETSPRPFARGAVGIATNGRDTGGSQFFIMHAYHPHLDGGYAVVGRVVSGMEIADALQADDAFSPR